MKMIQLTTTASPPSPAFHASVAPFLRLLSIVLLLLLLNPSACGHTQTAPTSASVEELFPDNGKLSPIPNSIMVGAYYYPWYSNDFHRDGGYMRELLEPKHRPFLGEYDDSRPEIVAKHLEWSRQANINVWFTSWWGPNTREDVTTRRAILPHEDLRDHKIALLYETTGRVRKREGYSMHNVKPDIEHMCRHYFDHPNYLRIDERPVLLLYLTRVMSSVGKLEEIVKIMRESCHHNMYIIGDQVWNGPPADDEDYAPFRVLDAVTNYDLYGNMNNPPYAGQDTIDAYYAQQHEWASRAVQDGVGYIPAVSPGYNDRGVRLEANHIALSRRLTVTSEPGSLFAAQIQKARYLTDPAAMNLLLVNSFNEWHEDTQIEPTIGEPTVEPDYITNGVEYSGYGELYLDILRVGTCGRRCNRHAGDDNHVEDEYQENASDESGAGEVSDGAEADTVFEGSPPSNVLVGTIYYPWLRPDKSSYLRKSLDPPQEPFLDAYDNPRYVISKHLELSRQYNIGLWILPWMGPGHISDTTARNNVLSHPHLGRHRIALIYETHHRLEDGNTSPSSNSNAGRWDESIYINIAPDIEYICDAYFHHPNYYRIHGRPVLFLSLSRVLHRWGSLSTVVSIIRNVGQSMGHNIFIAGDQVWTGAPQEEIYMPFLELDAVFSRDAYGNLISGSVLQDGRVRSNDVYNFYNSQRKWRDKAWRHKCAFIPSVTPGYNAGSNSDHPILRRDMLNGDGGSLFQRSVDLARYLVDSDVDNLMIVNSFNNFDDDTGIEPFYGQTTNRPNSLTGGYSYHGYENLYLDILLQLTADHGHDSDDEDGEMDVGLFQPLSCNQALDQEPCQLTWSALFGNVKVFDKEVVIPCGLCIVLDHVPGDALTLLEGLDVQGKLQISDGMIITIRTPYVRVQGELVVEATRQITAAPNIKIVFTKSRPGLSRFLPGLGNEHVCGSNRCDPGQKSMVVAGGQVRINGLPSNFKPWVRLVDVNDEQTRPMLAEDLGRQSDSLCSPFSPLLRDTMDSASTSSFLGSIGAQYRFQDFAIAVENRSSSYHGPQIDLKDIRSCLSAGTSYRMSFVLTLNKHQNEGQMTDCATSRRGDGCFKVILDHQSADGHYGSGTKFVESPSWHNTYGAQIIVIADIRFDREEIDEDNVFAALRFAGVAPEVDIVLSDFTLLQAPEQICASTSCDDLIACNGDGSLGSSDPALVPFEKTTANDNVAISVFRDDDDEDFWRVERFGDSNLSISGLAWTILSDCIVPHAVYRFRMRFRVHPNDIEPDPVAMSVYIRSHRPGRDTKMRIGTCPPSNREWVSCDFSFAMSDDLAGEDVEFTRIFLETVDATTVMYDIDDISVTYERMDGPVSSIWVEEVGWNSGSEILITSHSSKWDGDQVRHIDSVERGIRSGLTLINLDSPIVRPTTTTDSIQHGIEVALLSRNVVLEGEMETSEIGNVGSENGAIGGYLSIYRTPLLDQQISGVEFRRFGQAGLAGRHPLTFDRCGDVSGSLIKGNVIRGSYQRCVVLVETAGTTVDGNIGYDTPGHCIDLRGDSTTGNAISGNLVARTRSLDESPSVSKGIIDSEDVPASFHGTHWSNSWTGNVAAGSSGYGFMLENRSGGAGTGNGSQSLEGGEIDGSAIIAKRHVYDGCVAHSNNLAGFRFEGSEIRDDTDDFSGGDIEQRRLRLHGCRAFLNTGPGLSMFYHDSIAVQFSYFSDNHHHVEIELSRDVSLERCDLVSVSEIATSTGQVQSGFDSVCQRNPNALISAVKIKQVDAVDGEAAASASSSGASIVHVVNTTMTNYHALPSSAVSIQCTSVPFVADSQPTKRKLDVEVSFDAFQMSKGGRIRSLPCAYCPDRDGSTCFDAAVQYTTSDTRVQAVVPTVPMNRFLTASSSLGSPMPESSTMFNDNHSRLSSLSGEININFIVQAERVDATSLFPVDFKMNPRTTTNGSTMATQKMEYRFHDLDIQ